MGGSKILKYNKNEYCYLIAAETVSGVDEIDDFLLFLSNS